MPTAAPRARRPAPAAYDDYEADVLEGLEALAEDELFDLLGDQLRLADTRPGALRFAYRGNPHDLLRLRSVVAVYRTLSFPVPRPRALLGHQHFERLATTIAEVRALAPADAFRTLRISAAGEDSAVLTRLRDELADRTGLRPAVDEGDLLLRLRRATHTSGWEALVRISPRPLSTRAWRTCNRPGAPNAVLAHAIALLSGPAPDDRLLNVACGSGTLLVERLLLCPARLAIGCDLDADALDCARANLAAAGLGREARLEQWDATSMPLPDASVDVICADLPFGQLVGSHHENTALYPRLVAEAGRVAARDARMLLLTHELRLLERTLAEQRDTWEVVEVVRVRSGGMTPGIFLARRV